MTESLQSCPFCGSTKIELRDIAQQTLVAVCCGCKAEGGYNTIEHASTSREQAVTAWNTRAEASPKTMEREAVARIIDPDGWATFDRQRATLTNMGRDPETELGPWMYVKRSLAKADAILALSAPAPTLPHTSTGEA